MQYDTYDSSFTAPSILQVVAALAVDELIFVSIRQLMCNKFHRKPPNAIFSWNHGMDTQQGFFITVKQMNVAQMSPEGPHLNLK